MQWISMSVAKSFISALIGIAIDQRHIKSIDDAVTEYVPQLKNSAYDNVRIKDILQMSSGAAWNEDYSDPNSDINRSAKILAIGGSLDEFTASLKNELLLSRIISGHRNCNTVMHYCFSMYDIYLIFFYNSK